MFRTEAVGAEWFDQNVPCTQACPVLTNAGQYVSQIAAGDDELAYLTARLPNPFPSICGRVCAAPCELACRRGVIDEPIAIRALKRFVCEREGVESPEAGRRWREALLDQPSRDQRIAVIGSGPAGLACAHDLAAYGYRPVVFEAQDRPGGMMVLGIPTYRLRREVLQAEIRAILGLGVEIRTETALGRDFTLSSLREDGFAATFIATGALRSRELQIPGVELDGVLRAVEFLINANSGYRVDLGDRVVVVGGGNVALDVARTALREIAAGRTQPGSSAGAQEGAEAAAKVTLDVARTAIRMGAKEVICVALEARNEMPAHEDEIAEAEVEGVRILHRRGPKGIVGKTHVEGLETIEVSSVFDADGRFNPTFTEGTESILPCDSVILAIGQAPDLSWLDPQDGVEVGPRGTIAVQQDSLATSAPGIYAGGDVAFGPRNLIDAIGDGRRAAASIHQALADVIPGKKRFRRMLPMVTVPRPVLAYDAVPRVAIPSVSSERRIGVPEIELGYADDQARLEAARCLQCFHNISLDVDLCILCGGCVDICPERCISIVPAEDIEDIEGATAGGPESLLILQEDRCIRCALCIERCPSDALSMTGWNEDSTMIDNAVPA
ncbi:MAG: FAD-dependent oxidoreductase [Actinomycetota bacterium]|nr:FAD-dependent oxidoreductase [Actinomycetota bacterium]MDH5223331.1 FAD-dependent oxidoreductase [Actinomycetota bacterium]MDH5314328.1 FAD-dependent oxidoreductase [Actinomycetota bacterium]